VGEREKEKLPANDAIMSKIIIIGGSSGLGREMAAQYARSGHTVAVLARRGQLLTELKFEHPSIIIEQADISSDSIVETLGKLIGKLNGLDIIVIAASVIRFNTELNSVPESETISINVIGFTSVVHTAWQYFKSTGGGQIVGVTSIAAARGNKLAPAYHASKSYQSSYLESLRVKSRFEKTQIVVTELVPGYMDTAMGKGDRLFWVTPVKKAARQSIRAIRRKRKKVFISKRWWMVYHVQRLLPIFIYDWIVNTRWTMKKR
jgi:short-subunit dehydrogenase